MLFDSLCDSELSERMREAFEVCMALLHRLDRYAFSFHEQHYDDIGEQKEGLLQQRSHRLNRFHLLGAAKNLTGDSHAEIRELSVLILRVRGQ